jgi:hypothetical protein
MVKTILTWLLALLIGAGFAFFGVQKFPDAPLTMWIYASLDQALGTGFIEPFGRYLTGVLELGVSALVLILPIVFLLLGQGAAAARTQLLGALAALGVLAGAIASHLSVLGIATPPDVVIREAAPAQGEAVAFSGGYLVPQGEPVPFLFTTAIILTLAAFTLFYLRAAGGRRSD